MKDHVLYMSWNRPVIGRERTASELFNSVIGYLGTQVKKGNVENYQPVLLSVHGGQTNGFILVQGDSEKLHRLRNEDEFMKLVTQCALNVEGFGIVDGWVGDRLDEQMTRWRHYIK